MVPEPRVIFLSLEGLPGATMQVKGINQPEGTSFAIPVEPDKLRQLQVFVSQPKRDVKPGATGFSLIVEDKQSFERDVYSAIFEAPEK